MVFTDELRELNQQFENLLFNDLLLSKLAYSLLGIACLVYLFIAAYKLIRRRWNSIYFILLCVLIVTYSAFSLLALFFGVTASAEDLHFMEYIGMILIPALLVLHINLQISYRKMRAYAIVLYLIVPAFLVFIILRDIYFPDAVSIFPAFTASLWYLIVLYLYAAIVLFRSFLLCFKVFYQMPPRTRRSTKSTLVSVTALTSLIVFIILFRPDLDALAAQYPFVELLLPLVTPITLAVVIYPLFDSMRIMPARDVIVTSREFIMRGLSTTIFVLNRRYQILDWNKKDWDSSFPLPKPMYKEDYPNYRKRVLDQYSGRVSPHNAEVVIITKNGKESHFLMRTHEIGYEHRMFGYVVEISEITQLYSQLRDFEQIAHIDMLTGLYNRNAYLNYTAQVIREEYMPLTILIGDLNELKRINDVYGHLVGDGLITAVSKVVNDVKPENAFVARVGGDEFIVLVPNSDADTGKDFIRRANAMISNQVNNESCVPSVSWGYSLMTSADQSYNDSFAEADKMMYAYKKNRVKFTSSGILPQK